MICLPPIKGSEADYVLRSNEGKNCCHENAFLDFVVSKFVDIPQAEPMDGFS